MYVALRLQRYDPQPVRNHRISLSYKSLPVRVIYLYLSEHLLYPHLLITVPILCGSKTVVLMDLDVLSKVKRDINESEM